MSEHTVESDASSIEGYSVLACACPLAGTPHALRDCRVIPLVAAVLQVLREHWPESGGQESHMRALRAQGACADAILRVIPPEMTP